jgi:hypothetical protein
MVQGLYRRINGIKFWANPYYSTIMSVHLTIDKAGRVVIP